MDYKFSNDLLVHAREQDTFCGIRIIPNKGETVRQTLERCTVFNPPAVYPVINMIIKSPCGNEAFYRTLDDIPTVDTPCLCGNPDHYFVKIGD